MAKNSTFSVAIFKKQLPECCTPIDIVMACQKQYNESLIDMIQPINGLYRIDFKKREPQINILSKGLSVLGLTIPTTMWRPGMDSPQLRLVLGPLPKDLTDDSLSEALKDLGLPPSSPIQPDYWMDKATGRKTSIKTGKRIVFVQKPKTPVPDMMTVEDIEVPLWYWGKQRKHSSKTGNGNIFGQGNKTKMTDDKNNEMKSNQPNSSSLPPDDEIIAPTPPMHPIFKVPGSHLNENDVEKPRGRQRSRSTSASRKRSLSQGKTESPSKAKLSLEKLTPPSSYSESLLFPHNSEEASDQKNGVA